MASAIRLLIFFQLLGLVKLLLSVPLVLNRIPPNRWYGWRNAKTLSSQERWYAGNRFFGRCLLVAGGLLFTGLSFLWPLLPAITSAHVAITGSFTCVVASSAVWIATRLRIRNLA